MAISLYVARKREKRQKKNLGAGIRIGESEATIVMMATSAGVAISEPAKRYQLVAKEKQRRNSNGNQ